LPGGEAEIVKDAELVLVCWELMEMVSGSSFESVVRI
jgi:hypothetical protein